MISALELLDGSVVAGRNPDGEMLSTEMAGGVWLSLYCRGMERRCRGILRLVYGIVFRSKSILSTVGNLLLWRSALITALSLSSCQVSLALRSSHNR